MKLDHLIGVCGMDGLDWTVGSIIFGIAICAWAICYYFISQWFNDPNQEPYKHITDQQIIDQIKKIKPQNLIILESFEEFNTNIRQMTKKFKLGNSKGHPITANDVKDLYLYIDSLFSHKQAVNWTLFVAFSEIDNISATRDAHEFVSLRANLKSKEWKENLRKKECFLFVETQFYPGVTYTSLFGDKVSSDQLVNTFMLKFS